jgi:DNA-binding transcriptional MocR family regulator
VPGDIVAIDSPSYHGVTQSLKAADPKGGYAVSNCRKSSTPMPSTSLLEAQNVQVASGNIFSATGKYRNCIRINFANLPTRKVEMAVLKVGQLMEQEPSDVRVGTAGKTVAANT